MQGGGYFHDTTFLTQQPKHIFFFLFYINQPNLIMSLIQMLCKEKPLKRKIWEHKCEYRFLRFLMQLKYLNYISNTEVRYNNALFFKTTEYS